MNKLETAFAATLDRRTDILWYDFEAFKLRLADGAWYTPDFVIHETTGALLFVEVKGFWREAARVRLKVAADKYPFMFLAVTKEKKTGEWKYERIAGRAL